MSTIGHILDWIAVFIITWLLWDFLRAATRACNELAEFLRRPFVIQNNHTIERGGK